MPTEQTLFKGMSITREAVLTVLRSFDALYPDSNAYENWHENKIYFYALEHDGKLYPPKEILEQVSGISRQTFSGGYQTNRVFRDLGFTIVDKP